MFSSFIHSPFVCKTKTVVTNIFTDLYRPTVFLISTPWYLIEQACSEMVMPFCYDGKQDFFEPTPWDLQKYSQECNNKFGLQPRPYMVNKIYGGKNISAASNIVFR